MVQSIIKDIIFWAGFNFLQTEIGTETQKRMRQLFVVINLSLMCSQGDNRNMLVHCNHSLFLIYMRRSDLLWLKSQRLELMNQEDVLSI